MGLNKTPTFANRGTMLVYGHTDADAGNARTVVGAADNVEGAKLVGAFASNDAASPYDVALILFDGSDQFKLNTVTVPAGSGHDPSTPPVDLLTNLRDMLPVDADGQPYLYLAPGYELLTQPDASVASGKVLATFAVIGTFEAEPA